MAFPHMGFDSEQRQSIKLTVQVHIISSGGTVEKAEVGSISSIVIDYGYKRKNNLDRQKWCNITQLYAQTDSKNGSKELKFYYDSLRSLPNIHQETHLEPP
jgi:hypothetical protein